MTPQDDQLMQNIIKNLKEANVWLLQYDVQTNKERTQVITHAYNLIHYAQIAIQPFTTTEAKPK